MESNFVSESRVDMVVQRNLTSRCKGVSLLKSGKWGARINYMYKSYWLGSYKMEAEAAIAYDRAAIKLQRGHTSLNNHWTNYCNEEILFQSQYRTEQILNMLSEKTYSSELESFRSRHLSGIETQARTFMIEQGISVHLLFQKELTHRDVTHRCFVIPSGFPFGYFAPPEGISTLGEGEDWSTRYGKLTFYDKHGCSWIFEYSYWQSTQSFMFTNGWGHFIKMNNLNQNDSIMLYRCGYEGFVLGPEFYMIDFHRSDGNISLLGRNTEQLRGNMELEAEGMGEEPKKGVKLFGVQITR